MLFRTKDSSDVFLGIEGASSEKKVMFVHAPCLTQEVAGFPKQACRLLLYLLKYLRCYES